MKGEHGTRRVNDVEGQLAHQEEGESSDAYTSGSKQRFLHGRFLTHLSGTAGELTEPLLEERKTITC